MKDIIAKYPIIWIIAAGLFFCALGIKLGLGVFAFGFFIVPCSLMIVALICLRIKISINKAKFYILGIIVVALIPFLIYDNNNQTSSSGLDLGTPTIGGISEAFNMNGGGILVATDEVSYKQMYEAINAQDSRGISNLSFSGKVFSIPTGTKLLVLDMSFSSGTKVRIQDGPNKNKVCYIIPSFVKSK
jgi:hypothetical protein